MRCSRSLRPSPRQLTVVWPRRDVPTARRARSKSVYYTAVTIQLIDRSAAVCCRGYHLEFRELAISRLENLLAQVVQNPTNWVIGFSNKKEIGRTLHVWTAQAELLIFYIEKYESAARNRTSYLVPGRKLFPSRVF